MKLIKLQDKFDTHYFDLHKINRISDIFITDNLEGIEKTKKKYSCFEITFETKEILIRFGSNEKAKLKSKLDILLKLLNRKSKEI